MFTLEGNARCTHQISVGNESHVVYVDSMRNRFTGSVVLRKAYEANRMPSMDGPRRHVQPFPANFFKER
jgi:hypothetical protein